MRYGIIENGETRRRNEVALSVLVDECCICFDSELGTAAHATFGSGILRIYSDVRRVEFKCHGGEEDGTIYGYPLELVRWYTYKPSRKCQEY